MRLRDPAGRLRPLVPVLRALKREYPVRDAPRPGADYSAFSGPLPRAWLDAPSWPLWPGAPPGQHGVRARSAWAGRFPILVAGVQTPELRVFPAAGGAPRGAVLIVPGGGFSFLTVVAEGADVARRLSAQGLDAYVLVHRLPAEGWRRGAQLPLEDAQRAVRLIRARSAPGLPLAVLGFSAGGYVAAALAAWSRRRLHPPVDAADEADARPDAIALAYPIVTLEPPCPPELRARMVGWNASAARMRAASPHRAVAPGAPPVFLVHALDDPLADPEHSRLMAQACGSAGVEAHAEFLPTGGHGFSVAGPAHPAGDWLERFIAWLDRHGFLRDARA